MKKIIATILLLALAVVSVPALADGIRIGSLTFIGVTEDDSRSWPAEAAAKGVEEALYENDITYTFFDNLQSMLLALNSGEIDCFTIVSNTANYIAARNEGLVATPRSVDLQMGFSIAMLPENSTRIEAIDGAIAAMQADGTLDRLREQYIYALGADDPEPVALPVIEGAETIRIAVTGDMPPMDVILSDGTPAGFNTAFLAELSQRVGVNFEPVSVESSARAVALSSGVVDALFWTRGTYDANDSTLLYPLDNLEGIVISAPYLLDSGAMGSRQQ